MKKKLFIMKALVEFFVTVGGKSFNISAVVESIRTRVKPQTVIVTTVSKGKVGTMGRSSESRPFRVRFAH